MGLKHLRFPHGCNIRNLEDPNSIDNKVSTTPTYNETDSFKET